MDKPKITKIQLITTLKSRNLYSENVRKAVIQAEKSHKNQVRDDGQPYLTQHIFPVTNSIANRYFKDAQAEKLVIVSLLHDAPEDDHEFTFEKCTETFGKQITEYIRPMIKSYKLTDEMLTNDQKHSFYKGFMDEINKSDLITKIVKLEERLNNMQSTESLRHDYEKYSRFVSQVEEMFYPLAKEVSLHYYEALKKEVDRIMFGV